MNQPLRRPVEGGRADLDARPEAHGETDRADPDPEPERELAPSTSDEAATTPHAKASAIRR
jgi:hypothetical protein